MEQWMQTSGTMVNLLLREPATAVEKVVLLAAGFVALMVVFMRIGRSFGIPNIGMGHAVAMIALGGALSILAMSAARLYLAPALELGQDHWLLLGALVLAGLAFVAPLMCAVQKAEYLGAAMTWFISLIVGAVVIFAVSAAFDGFRNSRTEFQKTKARTEELDNFLKTN